MYDFSTVRAWGPLDSKIWGAGGGGGNDKKSDLSLQKSKKSIFSPKSGGAAAPCPPGSGPHEYEYIVQYDTI